MYRRSQYDLLSRRLGEPRRFVQVLAGPRQVGKTTLVQQVMRSLKLPSHYASADTPAIGDRAWIEQQWEAARLLAPKSGKPRSTLLVLDEIHKIPGWSSAVKSLWDADTTDRRPLRVVLLGSSPLLLEKGLTESLAGRFELIALPHWSFAEMKKAFGWGLDQYIYYGGYPGSAALVEEPDRWAQYIRDSLIETTISRDVLLMTRVDKPAILRRLFQLGCEYSGQVLSYQKMLGQLHDAGNTTTLAHYLDLLAGAGFLAGLQKYSGRGVRQRGSSPKLQILNTALMTAPSGIHQKAWRGEPQNWGRLVESAIGAHLVNAARAAAFEVFYWREGHAEVDFVVRRGKDLVAIEVKSGRVRPSLPGVAAFQKAYPSSRTLLVGGEGIPVERFLTMPVEQWLAA